MKISLCMICRDEEKKIERCINSIKQVVDEIVVVDTGSIDKTVEIARGLGARIFEMIWEDDFSKARNEALEKCQGDWIIFLDADEYFMEESTKELRGLIEKADNLKKDLILSEMLDQGSKGIQAIFKTIRIFRHHESIRYEGRVHEKLYKDGGELKGIDFSQMLKIYHDGYAEDAVQAKDKIERNIQLLLEEYKTRPLSSDICYYLMEAYRGKADWDKAWEFGIKTLGCDTITLQGIKEETYDSLLDLCRIIKKESIITEKLYNEALKVSKDFPDFDFRYGCYFYELKEHSKAIEYLEQCMVKMEHYKGLAMSKAMANVKLVLELLAECYLIKEKNQEAVGTLVKVLRIAPYEYVALYHLVKLLEIQETGEAIGRFLRNFYSFEKREDQEFLLEVSKNLGNKDLYEYMLTSKKSE